MIRLRSSRIRIRINPSPGLGPVARGYVCGGTPNHPATAR